MPVTVNLNGRCNSPYGIVCEANVAHSGWGGPLHLVVFLIRLMELWSGVTGAKGGVCIMGTGTAGVLKQGVWA